MSTRPHASLGAGLRRASRPWSAFLIVAMSGLTLSAACARPPLGMGAGAGGTAAISGLGGTSGSGGGPSVATGGANKPRLTSAARRRFLESGYRPASCAARGTHFTESFGRGFFEREEMEMRSFKGIIFAAVIAALGVIGTGCSDDNVVGNVFDAIDTNADKLVSSAEWGATFGRWDVNHDGFSAGPSTCSTGDSTNWMSMATASSRTPSGMPPWWTGTSTATAFSTNRRCSPESRGRRETGPGGGAAA